MRNKTSFLTTWGLSGVLVVAMLGSVYGQAVRPGQRPAAQAKDGSRPGEESDREALRQAAREFAEAFARGDAKAAASSWTERGEYHGETGEVLRGRAAIEQAYAAYFKEHPKAQIAVEVESIRFPARDMAVEEGMLQLKPAASELPTSTRYAVVHVREDGRWSVAIAREWGADDNLHDLAWLIGNWAARSKDRAVQWNFAWNEKKSAVVGRFSVKDGGRLASSGTQQISADPQTGQLRSWIFDDEGGHGQSLWSRDGNRWILNSASVLPGGGEAAAFNVLTRISDNEFIWRSVGRTIDAKPAPDTAPVKLTRVQPGK